MCQGEHRQALRYIQLMRPPVSSSGEVQLFLTVLLSNRCMAEAWGLLHQHATKVNLADLLKHMYETCREMGLMEELLQLPFTDTEQNDHGPRLRESAVSRSSTLPRYGKILPRVQRKLAVERAKPYPLPASVVRGVSRATPLCTVTKPAKAGNLCTRENFLSTALSNMREFWEGNEQNTGFSQVDRPRATEPPAITHPPPDAEWRDAFVGRPVTKSSRKRCRLPGLMVHPIPARSPARSPCRASTSFMAFSPPRSNLHGSISQKNFSGASELNLLETPPVVKRAKVLATSASGVAGFTPRSLLRSSLRTTPLATPSVSPGRSVTPPLRAKKPRVSFREENSNATWTVGVIDDSGVKAQTSEAALETPPSSEGDPSGNLQFSYDPIEQQFACDLPDDKDGECDAAEGDGELFISQSNFTLVLEEEGGEGEMGDLALVDASKPAGTTTEEKPVNSLGNTETHEHVTNSVSTVTNDQESQNIVESLPYVPEPIKVAIAENLLDVIKDTRSKEFTSEVVEQSIHETIGKKVTRFQKARAPLTTAPEGVEDETSIHHVEYVSTPTTRTRGQLSRSRSIPSAGAQQLLKADKPFLVGLSPRRSTRRTKEAPETSRLQTEENAQGEQTPVMPVTPRRGRKPKLTNVENVESSHSDGQTLSVSTQSIAVTPRRGLRRAKEATSEVLEEANEETSLAEGSITAPAASKRTRGGTSSAGDQGTGQTDTDRKVKPAVSPSRRAGKLKSISSQVAENIVKDQEAQPSDQVLLPVPTKRGRRRKMSSSEVSENSDLDLSKSSLPQMAFKLPVTPRRSARKGAQNLLAGTESLSTQEGIHSGGKVEILATPRRSTRRVPHAKPEETDTHEQTAAQPNEELTPPRTTARTGRRGRKRRAILEESTGEGAFPQGPGGSPLLLEDLNPSGRDETSRTSTDGIMSTRSRKTAVHQKLPVEENASFLFSPPLTKLTKKCKAGEADHPVQLKDLDPDLSSQFVFSPPLLRSRRKNVSSISQIGKGLELLTKEEEDAKSIESVGKQKLKRGRTARSKMKKASKTTRKEGSWSPPPVEIKFISPFGTPVDGTKSKQKETTDTAEKTLRKNKKRLSNFPKPVVRRKML